MKGIYIITNTVNGKQYVGKSDDMIARVESHLRRYSKCKALNRAIKKYGRDAFIAEFIEYPGASDQALSAIERWKIKQLGTYKDGYNCTEGGEGSPGVIVSDETRNKQSESAKRRIQEGSHLWSGESNPVHERIRSGRQAEIGRESAIKRKPAQKERYLKRNSKRDARILQLRSEGFEYREIARILTNEGIKCSKSTVCNVMKRNR